MDSLLHGSTDGKKDNDNVTPRKDKTNSPVKSGDSKGRGRPKGSKAKQRATVERVLPEIDGPEERVEETKDDDNQPEEKGDDIEKVVA